MLFGYFGTCLDGNHASNVEVQRRKKHGGRVSNEGEQGVGDGAALEGRDDIVAVDDAQ